jgi:D-amino-acid oxidase
MPVDVLVVGTGIIGLTSAVRLQQAGARVTLWYAEPPARTVSAVAAAVWYPTRTAAQPRVLGWGERTYAEYVRQAALGVPGVLLRETRMLLREPPPGDPWWGPAVPDLRPLRPGEYADPYVAGWGATVPLVEMPVYLAWLTDQFTGAGGVPVPRRIGTLAEATGAAPVVVNATGLAARDLCGDLSVEPARGQIIVTTNPGLRVSVRDEQHPGGYTYVHPRSSDVVLGGTFETGAGEAVTDPAALDGIWRRCLGLVPELAGAQRLRALAGLRPTRRDGVRLEREDIDGTRVIHNYGHGGAGMTLAWGCADRVVELAG